MRDRKHFLKVGMELISDLKDTYEEFGKAKQKRIDLLEELLKKDPKKFVKEYKSISGASDFDLPDIIYSNS